MDGRLKIMLRNARRRLSTSTSGLIGAIEKGFERARLSKVEIATNLDLSVVPNYVAYKAALIREKMLLQYLCVGVSVIVLCITALWRFEVSSLESKLRVKEYILAPGVTDFIPVSPQTVPDSYVQHAVSDFVATLGNTNPTNIEERFKQLTSLMSPALQIQFGAEAGEWIAKSHAENISEMTTILEKKIESGNDGTYHAVVRVRTDSYVGAESIGYRNEVIDMGLRLTPPDAGKRWFLEMTSLSRTSSDAYDTAKSLGGHPDGK